MADTNGFKDGRNKAELFLAPAQPVSRSLTNFSTLKLNITTSSNAAVFPGAVSTARDLTGALRHGLTSAIFNKKNALNLAVGVAGALTGFSALSVIPKIGGLFGLFGKAKKVANVLTGGIPSPEELMEFSGLKVGVPITAGFNAQIQERMTQLQNLTSRLNSNFSLPGLGGLTINENQNKGAYPLKTEIDVPSIPRLAQGGAAAAADSILKDKRRLVVGGVQVAAGKPRWWSRLTSLTQIKALPTLNPVVNQIFKDRTNAKTWSEPTTAYAAQFPYNKVQQTESGHVIELDDTPGAERVHIFHRSGSFVEFHPGGTVVYKSMRDGYDITMGDKFVKVAGSVNIAVDGNATLYAKGNVELQSDGEMNVQVKKDFNVYAQNINLRAKKTFKGDGTFIDLRYIQLPNGLVPVPMTGGLAPRINIGALTTDFPGSNIKSVLASMAKNPLDPKLLNQALKLNANTVAIPVESPLSNPAVYSKKSQNAIPYRNRLFDTPDETENYELYGAHVGLQKSLGDYTTDPRELSGNLVDPEIIITADPKPQIDYLNFALYKGTFKYADDFALGGTSFVLRDLVDLALYPDVVSPLKASPLPTGTITTTGTTTGTGVTSTDTTPREDNPSNL